MSGIEVIIDERKFLEFVNSQTPEIPGNTLDMLRAIKIANLGLEKTLLRKQPFAANVEIFQEDLIPTLPNSIFKFYIQISGAASVVDIRQKFGNQNVDGKVFDGVALAVSVPKEFNIPVNNRTKYNLFLETAAQVDLIRVVEFRIGQ